MHGLKMKKTLGNFKTHFLQAQNELWLQQQPPKLLAMHVQLLHKLKQPVTTPWVVTWRVPQPRNDK